MAQFEFDTSVYGCFRCQLESQNIIDEELPEDFPIFVYPLLNDEIHKTSFSAIS